MSIDPVERTPRRAVHRASFLLFAICLAAAGLVVACDTGNEEPNSTPVVASATDGEIIIAITSDGFEPSSVEIPRSAFITVRNSRDDTISVVLTGTSGDGEPREIPAGGFLQFRLGELGAQILTVNDDPDLAATLMVVPEDDAQ